MIGSDAVRALTIASLVATIARGPARLLGDRRGRVRRGGRLVVLRGRADGRAALGRAGAADAGGRGDADGAAVDRARSPARRSAAPCSRRPRRAVRRRRGVVRLLDVSLLAMRTPFQEQRERADTSPLRAQIAEGLRYLWRRPFLRTCALMFGIGNFVFPGLSLVIVVVGTRQGLTGGEIGSLIGGVRGLPARRLARSRRSAAAPSRTDDPAHGALDVDRMRGRVRRLAERVRPDRAHRPDCADESRRRTRSSTGTGSR